VAKETIIAIIVDENLADGSRDEVDDLTPDVCVARSYKYGATVTRNPVEKGATPSDHRVRHPFEMTLVGSFHETRLDASSSSAGLQGDGDQVAPGPHCMGKVQAWVNADKNDSPITVTTELDIHDDMMIEEFNPSRGENDGDSVPFTARLVQLEVTESQSGSLPADVTGNLKRKRSKSKAKKTATQLEMDTRLAKEVEAGRVSPEVASGPVDAQAVTDQGSWYDAGVGT
jgi:hypothetical protein